MVPAIFSARTPQELEQLSEKHGLRIPLQLNVKEQSTSASRWTLRHLIAYRLLVNPEKVFLQTFRLDHDRQCPVCVATSDRSQQQVDRQMTAAFTQDSCPANLLKATESELLRLQHGPFWVALGRAMQSEHGKSKDFPQRERTDVERQDFVNSTTAIEGSSSPSRPSSSEFEASISNIDEDEYDARRSQPEEVTTHLVTSFLQQSLQICLQQDYEGTSEIRPRTERRRSEILFSKTTSVSSQKTTGEFVECDSGL